MKGPDGKYIFGVCKVNEKGQIVIPKEAREVFNINSGDNLLLLGDIKSGMALVKTEIFQDVAENILSPIKRTIDDNSNSNK